MPVIRPDFLMSTIILVVLFSIEYIMPHCYGVSTATSNLGEFRRKSAKKTTEYRADLIRMVFRINDDAEETQGAPDERKFTTT